VIEIKLQARIDKLFEQLQEGKTQVDLKNGETLYLSNDDLIMLYSEAITFAEVVDNNGKVENQVFGNLSDDLKKMTLAYPKQNKLVDIISTLAKGASPDEVY